MDARQALDDLMEVSAQVEAAVLFAADGGVEASTIADESRAGAFEAAARALVGAAADLETGAPLTQVQTVTSGGCAFVVRAAGRAIAATTGPSPNTGLVIYDLRTCLRNAAPPEPTPAKPKPTRRKAKSEDTAETA